MENTAGHEKMISITTGGQRSILQTMKPAVECMLEKRRVQGETRVGQFMHFHAPLVQARVIIPGLEDKVYAMQPMWSHSASRVQGLPELWRQAGRK
jgi:hypothetical protein